MFRKRLHLVLACLTLLLGLNLTPVLWAQDQESLGLAAEQAGRLREALKHYVAALQSVSEGSASDQALREKIISLVQKLSPAPVVPEEARRFAVRGQIAVREAKSQADYVEAAGEFNRALKLAPWWAESYFNLAVAQGKAGQFNEATRSLKLYLLAAPNAPDAEKVKDQIYALEYRQERARKDAQDKADETRRQEQARREADERRRREAEAAEQAKQRSRQIFASLTTGRWNVSSCPNGDSGVAEFRMIGTGQLERRDWSNSLSMWYGWSWSDWGSWYYWYDESTGRIMRYTKQDNRSVESLRIISSNQLDPVENGCRVSR